MESSVNTKKNGMESEESKALELTIIQLIKGGVSIYSIAYRFGVRIESVIRIAYKNNLESQLCLQADKKQTSLDIVFRNKDKIAKLIDEGKSRPEIIKELKLDLNPSSFSGACYITGITNNKYIENEGKIIEMILSGHRSAQIRDTINVGEATISLISRKLRYEGKLPELGKGYSNSEEIIEKVQQYILSNPTEPADIASKELGINPAVIRHIYKLLNHTIKPTKLNTSYELTTLYEEEEILKQLREGKALLELFPKYTRGNIIHVAIKYNLKENRWYREVPLDIMEFAYKYFNGEECKKNSMYYKLKRILPQRLESPIYQDIISQINGGSTIWQISNTYGISKPILSILLQATQRDHLITKEYNYLNFYFGEDIELIMKRYAETHSLKAISKLTGMDYRKVEWLMFQLDL